jgi:hypothetical protein
MEKAEQNDSSAEGIDPGTPQQRLRDDEPGAEALEEPEAEGGADSAAEAGREGG